MAVSFSLSLSHTLGVCVCVCAVCAFFYKLFSSHMAAAFICAMWLVSNALSDSKRFEVAWRSGSASGSKGGSMGATTMGGLDRCIRLAFWQFAHTHTQNVHKLYGQKFEATQEAEQRETEGVGEEEGERRCSCRKDKDNTKVKVGGVEVGRGLLCCCCCCLLAS